VGPELKDEDSIMKSTKYCLKRYRVAKGLRECNRWDEVAQSRVYAFMKIPKLTSMYN
jgi:hypothetical protein